MEYEIQGSLAKLNEHDAANRKHRIVGAKLKEEMTNLVALQLMGKAPAPTPCTVTFYWRYSTKHDYDNIRFGCKYILDGMKRAGVIPDDNPKYVRGFGGDFFEKVAPGQDGVTVVVSPVE